MQSVKGIKLTFYGHFTGHSSYPVVCHAIANWMVKRGIDLRIVNLRENAPVQGYLALHQVPANPVMFSGSQYGNPTQRRPGAGFLFGFPSWYAHIPTHESFIGYHVCDVRPIPTDWKVAINGRGEQVITASRWCSELFHQRGISAQVVRHGLDPEIFKPDLDQWNERTVLRHFCSSPDVDRKGTTEVLEASRALLNELDDDVLVKVSVPESVVEPIAEKYSGFFRGGQIEVITDEPGDQQHMAKELQSVTAVVQPSRAEGFGMIPLESVACGTPVVLTDVTGHSEYVSDLKHAAFVVETDSYAPCCGGSAPSINQDSLVAAMKCAVRYREEMKSSAFSVSEEIRSNWSWDAVLDKDLLPILASLSNLQ